MCGCSGEVRHLGSDDEAELILRHGRCHVERTVHVLASIVPRGYHVKSRCAAALSFRKTFPLNILVAKLATVNGEQRFRRIITLWL
jgi:hypothetical protein